jgi:hypothetical protein
MAKTSKANGMSTRPAETHSCCVAFTFRKLGLVIGMYNADLYFDYSSNQQLYMVSLRGVLLSPVMIDSRAVKVGSLSTCPSLKKM